MTSAAGRELFSPQLLSPYWTGPSPEKSRSQEKAMEVSQIEVSSWFTRKKIAIAVAILTICGLGVWWAVEAALRMTSGQS